MFTGLYPITIFFSIFSHLRKWMMSGHFKSAYIHHTCDKCLCVCLLYMYNITVSWRSLGLQELCQCIIQVSTMYCFVTLTCISNGERVLPALHALTGCDTSGKVSTEFVALKASYSQVKKSLLITAHNWQNMEAETYSWSGIWSHQMIRRHLITDFKKASLCISANARIQSL